IAITAEVGSLAEATRLIHEEGHLLIEVNAPDIETDSESLQALKERGQVTILASFPLPRQPAENQPAENQPAENQPAENQNKEDSGWRVYQWQFRNDWRKIFLQWISERIEGDAPFNVSAFSDWLFQEDSEGTLFPVPDDLLPFCAYAYEKGEDQLVGLFQGAQSKADFAAEWLRQLIEEKAKAISEHTGRLRQHGVEAVRGLIAQRIQNLSYPWLGGLREKDWVSMIPDELAPETSSYEDIQRELEGIKECTEEERNQKIRSAEMILKDDKRRVISNLKALGVLRPQASGLLDLYPRWVVNWRGQKWVENALKKKPGVWGGCRVDRDRCSIIESILDECTDEKIMELSEQAVQDFTPSRLGDAGAIEALFSEIAKRLRPSNKFETHRELLHELWRHQKRLM
ncbi:MAG: hypothetical protein QF675_11980, partial [SAR324 cluster bacterium]|nr:hypothetical protein [SAR324 cluster bacterium]